MRTSIPSSGRRRAENKPLGCKRCPRAEHSRNATSRRDPIRRPIEMTTFGRFSSVSDRFITFFRSAWILRTDFLVVALEFQRMALSFGFVFFKGNFKLRIKLDCNPPPRTALPLYRRDRREKTISQSIDPFSRYPIVVANRRVARSMAAPSTLFFFSIGVD